MNWGCLQTVVASQNRKSWPDFVNTAVSFGLFKIRRFLHQVKLCPTERAFLYSLSLK
jgi:hypothetical protein